MYSLMADTQHCDLKRQLLAQSPHAKFIESDWTDWLTPHVTAHLLSHGRFLPVSTPVREELGVPLRCHFTVLDRWRERIGSQAYFGFGLYPYKGRSYWWLHSWLIDAEGVLIDSAHGQDKDTRYYGAPWSKALLAAVIMSPDHPFDEILLDGLKSTAPTKAVPSQSTR